MALSFNIGTVQRKPNYALYILIKVALRKLLDNNPIKLALWNLSLSPALENLGCCCLKMYQTKVQGLRPKFTALSLAPRLWVAVRINCAQSPPPQTLLALGLQVYSCFRVMHHMEWLLDCVSSVLLHKRALAFTHIL